MAFAAARTAHAWRGHREQRVREKKKRRERGREERRGRATPPRGLVAAGEGLGLRREGWPPAPPRACTPCALGTGRARVLAESKVVKLPPCDLEATGSSRENSLLQKCRERLRTIDPKWVRPLSGPRASGSISSIMILEISSSRCVASDLRAASATCEPFLSMAMTGKDSTQLRRNVHSSSNSQPSIRTCKVWLITASVGQPGSGRREAARRNRGADVGRRPAGTGERTQGGRRPEMKGSREAGAGQPGSGTTVAALRWRRGKLLLSLSR
ncbi:hypothetical protein U9M48_022440 [Paspalum notatum var. saurae]|uniref:Uncharacterized protein n=1 Tax=Paspalum notatum var. saurae TaxID=547442 RepID=A0AAQ3WUS0_PASNO